MKPVSENGYDRIPQFMKILVCFNGAIMMNHKILGGFHPIFQATQV